MKNVKSTMSFRGTYFSIEPVGGVSLSLTHCQTFGYIPSRRTTLPFGLLVGWSHLCRLLSDVQSPMSCSSQFSAVVGKWWFEICETRNAWQSPACSPPGANARAKNMGYWTNVHQIFVRRRGIIGSVNAHIYFTIRYDTIQYIYVRSKADEMASLI